MTGHRRARLPRTLSMRQSVAAFGAGRLPRRCRRQGV